jgi:hypothetical protein
MLREPPDLIHRTHFVLSFEAVSDSNHSEQVLYSLRPTSREFTFIWGGGIVGDWLRTGYSHRVKYPVPNDSLVAVASIYMATPIQSQQY